MTMKAMTLAAPGGLDQIKLVERAAPPAPAAGEITIRVEACSLNFHDLGVANGRSPTKDGRILLSDGAGTVEAIGSDVTDFAVGDRVMSRIFPQWLDGPPQVGDFSLSPGDGVDGFACESVTAAETAFTHVPAGYSSAEAATVMTAGLTAWRALMVNGPLHPDDTILVQGSGGVSIFALQIAKAVGARVIATSSSDEKLERLRELGAAHVINYRKEPQWGKRAFEWTGGTGVDHVIDVGGGDTLAQSLSAVRIGGHIAIVGLLGGLAVDLPIIPILSKQARMQGCLVGSRADQLNFNTFLEKHKIKPIIGSSFALEDLADAFEFQQKGAHFGKIVLEV
ncbi:MULTISPECIES: NAD(P)-dependent alcohol dehydrogenase [Sphingobium]